MEKLITDRDMKDQISAALDGSASDFDIDGIFDEIHAAHGLIDIEGLNGEEFWDVVARHDLSVQNSPGPGGV